MSLRGLLAVAVVSTAMGTTALAADLPILRGSFSNEIVTPGYARWEGLTAGVQGGYSSLTADFADSNATLGLSQKTTSGGSFGAFVGYNVQWDSLVVGLDGAYNHMSSLEATAESTAGGNTVFSTFELVDYATLRARAGYAFDEFLPYAFIGGAVGRINYATDVNGVSVAGRDNAFSAGFVAGLGLDVALPSNIFLRGEYEFVAFSPVGGIRSQLNTGRVGVGARF